MNTAPVAVDSFLLKFFAEGDYRLYQPSIIFFMTMVSTVQEPVSKPNQGYCKGNPQ